MRKKKGAFGVVYQDVMRSPRLTPESKAIYAYLASMAGGDDECYPSGTNGKRIEYKCT